MKCKEKKDMNNNIMGILYPKEDLEAYLDWLKYFEGI
jgi:hypothetical protein